MHAHFPKYVAGVLMLAIPLAVGCSESTPAAVTAPTTTQQLSLTAQPDRVRPEFEPALGVCRDARGFRTRFVVVVGGLSGLIVQGLDVSFVDDLGFVTVPTVLPPNATQTGSMITSSPPIPLPSSMPIPIPTSGPNNGLSVGTGGAQEVPVFLAFGCHVRPHGTIVIHADTRDHRGRPGRSRLAVELGI